jgi:hypothetical protein
VADGSEGEPQKWTLTWASGDMVSSMAARPSGTDGLTSMPSNCQLPIANCQLPIANCQLPNTASPPPAHAITGASVRATAPTAHSPRSLGHRVSSLPPGGGELSGTSGDDPALQPLPSDREVTNHSTEPSSASSVPRSGVHVPTPRPRDPRHGHLSTGADIPGAPSRALASHCAPSRAMRIGTPQLTRPLRLPSIH